MPARTAGLRARRRRPVTVPGGDDFAQNRPAGLPLFFDDTMDVLSDTTITPSADGFWYSGQHRKVTDITAPYGTKVLEAPFVEGDTGDGNDVGAFGGPNGLGHKHVYFAQMIWLSANYSFHTIEEKYFYPPLTLSGNGLFAWRRGVGGTDAGFSWSSKNTSSIIGRIPRGVWFKIELEAKMNTPGNADGIWRTWVNGTLAGEFTDMDYSTHPSSQVEIMQVKWDTTRGGGTSAEANPAGMVRRMDRLAIYASPTL